MRVLSFGTKGKFEEYISRLRDSLNEHGLRHELEIVPPQRHKFEAALGKPRFILERLTETVLWLDADSFVTGEISLPGGEWDAGFLKHWGTHKGVTCCALAFNPTVGAREFLERWAEVCERKSREFSGTEHDRMHAIRDEAGMAEIELTPFLTGKLIVNYKIRKEHYV